MGGTLSQNCFRSSLVDPAEWSKIGLLKRDVGSLLSVFFPGKNSKTQSSQNFFGPDPGNLLNLTFRDWPRSGGF